MTALALLPALLLAACASADEPGGAAPVHGYEIVATHPHDTGAFTQGFLFHGGHIYESTGRHGESSVRRVDLETGEVLARTDLPFQYFGEGLTVRGDQLVMLTWRSGTGFVFDLDTLEPEAAFRYPGEGWGLTTGPDALYMSDGTAEIRRLDPDTLEETGRFEVTADGAPLDRINELEWIDGEIWANVWMTDRIARIDPDTGEVASWIDLTGLRQDGPSGNDDVLNGIAWDAETGRVFVTGKLWPHVYEIAVIEAP